VIVSDLTERELVARIRRTLQPPPDWLVVGIGDDAAIVEPERNRLEALTVDALVEGIHFDRRFTPPEAIGHRALAVNLSDLAAMGAAPRLALLSLALPADLPCEDFDGIAAGLAALAAAHRLHVVGGNLTRSPGPLVVDVTVIGSVKRRQTLTRGGARPGDEIYVSGTIGTAAAGLDMLRAGIGVDADATPSPDGRCVARYLFPEPRVRLGVLLARNRAASSCMDLSDGLGDAVHQVAEASGVGAVIDAEALPIEDAARDWFRSKPSAAGDALTRAIASGDDYELLFTVHPRLRGRLRSVMRHSGITVTKIGVCTDTGAVLLRRLQRDVRSDEPLPSGFTHFR
jgi:thiamine-monophosphate kinase